MTNIERPKKMPKVDLYFCTCSKISLFHLTFSNLPGVLYVLISFILNFGKCPGLNIQWYYLCEFFIEQHYCNELIVLIVQTSHNLHFQDQAPGTHRKIRKCLKESIFSKITGPITQRQQTSKWGNGEYQKI